MTIPAFGWRDGTTPAVDAANLEAMLQAAGSYTDTQVAATLAAAEAYANSHSAGVQSITSTDGSITVAGTGTNPILTVTTGRFDAAGAAATAQTNAETFATNALNSALAGTSSAESPAAARGSALTHSGVGQTVGGVVVTSGMRILDTANAVSAGLWVAASGSWTRPVDFATGSNVQGKLVEVDDGTVWMCVSFGAITVDTTTQLWMQIDASALQFGSGLVKNGQTVSLALTKALITATGLTYSDVGADAAGAASLALQKSNNLSDLSSTSTARTNLGLGTAATQPSTAFDSAGTASSLVNAETTRAEAAEGLAVQKANNLSDLTNEGTARVNLGIEWLTSAQAVISTNVSSLSGIPGSTLADGVTLSTATNDIVLLIGQSTSTQNGPWVIASGSWSRPADFANGLSFRNRYINISQGTTYGGQTFSCENETALTVGTSAITFIGGGGSVTASGVAVVPTSFQQLSTSDTDAETTFNDIDANLYSLSSAVAGLVSPNYITRLIQNSDGTWPARTGPTEWIALGTYQGAYTTGTGYNQDDLVIQGGNMYSLKHGLTYPYTAPSSFASANWNQVPLATGDDIASK